MLASVLFTDVVDSTGRAAALGDRRWRQLIDRHDRVARAEVERFQGRLVKTTGDGIMGEGDIGGIGVHIAARLLAEAEERQVVVTRTVRDLATGSDLSFAALGAASLRGVPGEWELFEASTRQGN